jgi:hypothetical protein
MSSCAAEQLLASQDGLGSMEFVSYITTQQHIPKDSIVKTI